MCGGASMLDVDKRVAKIDGGSGKYNENSITNPSVRYGRNSVRNFYSYLEEPIVKDNKAVPPVLDFGTDTNAADKNVEKIEKYVKENDVYFNSLPPLEYEYRYMPNINRRNEVDKDALLGAAYEELGGRKDVSVEELDKSFALNDDFSTKPIDLNNDGKIDVGEYGATILASDVISNDGSINGTINRKGHITVQELTKKANAEAAAKLYSSLYNKYNLSEAVNKFNPEG